MKAKTKIECSLTCTKEKAEHVQTTKRPSKHRDGQIPDRSPRRQTPTDPTEVAKTAP
uniref:Uncharacterized protein n=1 Tax=Brassica oleracea var. oleracea TaxID=109376 RepID=A0A0D3BE97_BRAOL